MSAKDIQAITAYHNKVRTDVGVGPMKWSAALAVYAQEWADHLAATTCRMAHRTERKYGENLYQGTAGYYTAVDAAKGWESEKIEPRIPSRSVEYPFRTRGGARTRYRRSRPIAESAPKRRLPPRMAPPTPCRRRRRKGKRRDSNGVNAFHWLKTGRAENFAEFALARSAPRGDRIRPRGKNIKGREPC